MRILAIQPLLRGELLNPAAGGKNKAALTLARRLASDGHEIFLLPWKGERYADTVWVKLGESGEQATALPTLRLPGPAGGVRIARRFLAGHGLPLRPAARLRAAVKEELLGRRRRLEAAVDQARPDLIHVHESHSDCASVYRSMAGERPILLTHHSPGLAEGCGDYDHVVFVSRRQRRQALARWPELADRSSVIYYFAAREYFRHHRPEAASDLVFVGNLDSDRKGLSLLTRAWAGDSRLNRFRLQVVGEGGLRRQYEEEAREAGANLMFLGRRSAVDIAAIHAEAAAFVMPSRGEGLALAYIEALCMGLPILGFGPNVEELTDLLGMRCGISYDAAAESAAALGRRVLRLLDPQGGFSPERRLELQRRARRLFAQARFENEYLDLYRNLLAEAGGPSS